MCLSVPLLSVPWYIGPISTGEMDLTTVELCLRQIGDKLQSEIFSYPKVIVVRVIHPLDTVDLTTRFPLHLEDFYLTRHQMVAVFFVIS